MNLSQHKTVIRNIICEAYGCLGAAEENINIPVGQSGEIEVSVCSRCRPKFIHRELDGDRRKFHYKNHDTEKWTRNPVSRLKKSCEFTF